MESSRNATASRGEIITESATVATFGVLFDSCKYIGLAAITHIAILALGNPYSLATATKVVLFVTVGVSGLALATSLCVGLLGLGVLAADASR